MKSLNTIVSLDNCLSVEVFDLFFCHLIDLPSSRVDSSTEVPGKCIFCPILGSYFTGEGINAFGSPGHVLCIIIWILTLAIGIFGIFNNILIIAVLKKRKSESAFKILIILLASADFFCCILSIVASTSNLAYFENWTGRGKGLMNWYYFSCFFLLFGRSGSTFMTVLITIERYVVIAHPLKSETLFTKRRSLLMAFCVLVIATFLSIPRIISTYVDDNDIADIPSTKDLTSIIRSTEFHKFWYLTVYAVHDQIDFWLPFPLLLFFNVLSFRHVQRLSKKRKEMNLKQKMDIRAVKMFLPVVIVLFLCNIEVVINYVVVLFANIVYREFYMGLLLSVAINSSSNFPIYYFRESRFKAETRALLSNWFPSLQLQKSNDEYNPTAITFTVASSSNGECLESMEMVKNLS